MEVSLHMCKWRLEQRLLSAMLRNVDYAAGIRAFVNPVPPQQLRRGCPIDHFRGICQRNTS